MLFITEFRIKSIRIEESSCWENLSNKYFFISYSHKHVFLHITRVLDAHAPRKTKVLCSNYKPQVDKNLLVKSDPFTEIYQVKLKSLVKPL